MQFTILPSPPPSPEPESEDTTSNESIPDGKILCVTIIAQTFEQTLVDVSELRNRLSDDENFWRCLVPADQLERDKSGWAQIKDLPGIYPVAKINSFNWEVAVSESRVQWLRKHGFPFEMAEGGVFHDIFAPTKGETRVHGAVEARRKAKSRFIQNAVRGISSKHGRGLDNYLRQRIVDKRALALIEMAIVIRDILESPPDVRSSFAEHCSFLAELLRDVGGAHKSEAASWIEHFQWSGAEEAMHPVENQEAVSAVMHGVSLRRGLLESAGGAKDTFQHCFDVRYSARENLMMLGEIIGIEDPTVTTGLNELIMTELALHGMFGRGNLDVIKLGRKIMEHVPVGYLDPMCEALPADVVLDVRYEAMHGFVNQATATYELVPLLKESGNHMRILVCHVSGLPSVGRALCQWAASKEGDNFYHDVVLSLTDALRSEEPLNVEQMVLDAATLVSYLRLLPYSPDDSSNPIHGSFLSDFALQVAGKECRNRRAVWERMVYSISLAVGGRFNPATLDFLMATVKHPLSHLLDGLSHSFWRFILCDGLAGPKALEKTLLELEEAIKIGEDKGWGLEGDDWVVV